MNKPRKVGVQCPQGQTMINGKCVNFQPASAMFQGEGSMPPQVTFPGGGNTRPIGAVTTRSVSRCGQLSSSGRKAGCSCKGKKR